VVWTLTGALSCFDGKTWKTYEIDGNILSFATAPDGTIWVGGWDICLECEGCPCTGFLFRLGGKDLTTYGGLNLREVTNILVTSNDILWITTPDGVFSFDGETWTSYSQSVSSIAAAANGELWAGTDSGDLVHFDGNTWTSHLIDNGLTNNSIRAITIASDGKVWVGTYGNGISSFDGQVWHTLD
jgi:ligand-binding sensor domain-containing protein